MVTPFYANPDQAAFMERLDAFKAKIDADPRLRDVPQVIEQARGMIEIAAEMKLPVAAYVQLQIMVSAHDNRRER